MKLVIAVIRPEQLPAVKQALFDAQIQHLTATTVMGTAPKSEQQMYRGVQREVSLFRRIEVKVAVNDSQLETAIDIRDHSFTLGNAGLKKLLHPGQTMCDIRCPGHATRVEGSQSKLGTWLTNGLCGNGTH